ncbi:MAG: four helix bundle protein [Bacteroidales bacterium]|nr:four helix bundle protein [Bacteroidales bacterium]
MDAASNERNLTFFRFEDLRIYHKALEYMSWVHTTTLLFPDTCQDNIGARFNEAARAIALHIAEGSARNKSQFIYYLKMAKSSVRESLVLTSAVKKFGYVTDKQEDESRNFLMELTKMIGALISSLQRGPTGVRDSDDTDEDLDVPHHSFDSEHY